MDLALTEEQEMIKNAAREFVEQEFPKELLLEIDQNRYPCNTESWGKLIDTGLLGTLIPSEYGGEGGSFTNAGIVFEELGRGPVPGPHLSSFALSVNMLLNTGSEQQKQQHLKAIANGSEVVVPAISDSEYGWTTKHVSAQIETTETGLKLNTNKSFVIDGLSATHFIVAAKDDEGAIGFYIIAADSEGIETRELTGFAWHMAEVKFVDVAIVQGSKLEKCSWQEFEKSLLVSSALLSSYQVGGCQFVYELSVDYSRTRVQFGTPIGRFQRVQDHIINLVNSLDGARWTTNEALWKIDSGKEFEDSCHLAKAVASQAYLDCCTYGHEVHAGIGSLNEYGLTLHTTASRSLFHYLGDPRYHKEKLAAVLGL
ncbi:MAG: acyl-CoA dehydrogenase [SAR202 cluster bacterium]|jgi:alkylation response protein AidB-like acyl-CoA dehydrogenase|nr:acyl-CoA dehydrogenase [SAR202 cluster bacterium]MQG52669.1 acyl-CoA dehydrogenase [SAR202 cluster bacterium]|tara:strand:+ start:1775 stop:2884 length:1110 start_codon:yes stop_codon:yes gene_type:complete